MMKKQKTYMVLRLLFGLMLVVFGLNPFLQLFALPEFNDAGTAFLTALGASGYMMNFISLILLGVGVSYLLNKYVNLANLVLLPVSLNIMLFHLLLDQTGIVFGALVLLLNLYMLWVNFSHYKDLLKA